MIFLDNNSTTPVDSRVQKVIADSVGQNFGNPHSLFHKTGINASSALSKARKNIAEFFGVENEYVVFNSGATEANNQFIIGSALKALSEKSDRKKIFCSAVEHKCVLNAADYLQSLGFEKYEIPVDKKGQVSLEYLKQNLDENTLLVSVMAVNNETGFSSPLKEVGQLAKERGILFHSDFAQGLMRSWEPIADMHLDAISISGHKICGPKGIGALVFTTSPTDLVEPIIHGGLQEGDIRSGTVPVFLVSALSECLTILRQEGDKHQIKIKKIKDIFFDNLKKKCPEIELNNKGSDGHPGTLNLFFPNVEAEMMCAQLANDVAISAAAACNGLKQEYSYVLQNMGFPEQRAASSVRLCFGRDNTEEEALIAVDKIVNVFKKLNSF